MSEISEGEPPKSNSPTKVEPDRQGNFLTRGLKRIIGSRNPQTLNFNLPKEQNLTISKEGEVPLIEVARLIREKGDIFARNLYPIYKDSFSSSFGPENIFEDKKNKVQLRRWSDRRDISVFIVPPNSTAEGNALAIEPRVTFMYKKNEMGEWNYEGSIIHGDTGYIDVSIATEELDKKFGSHFWNNRVRVGDLERALVRYLDKDQTPYSTLALKPGVK